MLEAISVALAALYLRGLSRPSVVPRRRWTRVVSGLRTADVPPENFSEALREDGLWEEAMVLDNDALCRDSASLVEQGHVITAVSPGYPRRWMERLGDAAPPALWICGGLPVQDLVGIVGGRHVDPEVRGFASAVGAEAVRLGCAVVSGGAAGCDYAGAGGAVASGGSAIEILPHGIDLYERKDRCGLSVCPPDEPFSTAAAMERNALIYAASEATVVVQARFKQGGTWLGAADATRRRLCPLIVRDDGGQASRALIGLGATPITEAGELGSALARSQVPRGLFGIG